METPLVRSVFNVDMSTTAISLTQTYPGRSIENLDTLTLYNQAQQRLMAGLMEHKAVRYDDLPFWHTQLDYYNRALGFAERCDITSRDLPTSYTRQFRLERDCVLGLGAKRSMDRTIQ